MSQSYCYPIRQLKEGLPTPWEIELYFTDGLTKCPHRLTLQDARTAIEELNDALKAIAESEEPKPAA
jgi:hypothetical protein